MGDIFGGIGSILFFIFAAVAILAPIWLYLINVYTGASRDELRKTNKLLKQVVDLLEKQNIKPPEPVKEETATSNTVTMTCKHCGKSFKYGISHSGKYKPCPGCHKSIFLK